MDQITYQELSTALQSDEPIKELVTKTLNMMIEKEFENRIGASYYCRSKDRVGYRCGYRTRKLQTTAGTLVLKIPHPKKGGYIPSFLKRYQRFDETLKKMISEAYVNGVSTGKMKHLVKAMGIDSISRGQVTAITSMLNNEAETFRRRPLEDHYWSVLYIDALFQKVRSEDTQGSKQLPSGSKQTAFITVVGADPEGHQEVLAIEPFPDESAESYSRLIKGLLNRGLIRPKLIISDGAAGLQKAMHDLLPGTKWQRCRVHFVRNVTQSLKKADKVIVGQRLKKVYHTANKRKSHNRAYNIIRKYESEYPTAMSCLRNGLNDTLTCLKLSEFNTRKITTSNIVESLNSEYRRRIKSIGVFPNVQSCLKLLTMIAIKWSNRYTYLNIPTNDNYI